MKQLFRRGVNLNRFFKEMSLLLRPNIFSSEHILEIHLRYTF